MNSPIKLPELPSSADPVEVIVEGRPAYREAWRRYYTEHQLRAYAEQAVRDALDHAFNELNVLFMETLKARTPDDDLEDNDEKFNIGICAQALGISRCQHVLQGLNTRPENNHGDTP